MKKHPHTLLKNIYKGEDIWVVCSGPSLNYVTPSFFDGKIVVGVNRVFQHLRCDYCVCKDPSGFKYKGGGKTPAPVEGDVEDEFRRTMGLPLPGAAPLELITQEDLNGSKILISEREYGNKHFPPTHFHLDFYYFSHLKKVNTEGPNLEEIQIDSDEIVVSYSTTTSAMHLAAYMGAKNIILCGHDCGTIDGEINVRGYYTSPAHQMVQRNVQDYTGWIKREIEKHSIDVKNKLREVYGVNVHSLNPFINFNLEGHSFEGK